MHNNHCFYLKEKSNDTGIQNESASTDNLEEPRPKSETTRPLRIEVDNAGDLPGGDSSGEEEDSGRRAGLGWPWS